METLNYQLPSSLSFDTCEQVENEIKDLLSKKDYDAVILDASGTKYISSAGLRVVLSIKKQIDNTSVINASTEVYDIFEMTGFTKIVNIEKAYPVISIEGCPLIGKGAHGAVYRLAPDTIVKVYYDEHTTIEDIKNERELSKKAFVMGLPTAIALQIVKVGEHYGTIFELLDATSCTKYVNESQENTDAFIDKAVKILKYMHSREIKDGSLPDMKQLTFGYLEKVKAFLDQETYDKLHRLISDIPDSKTLIHGDFHLKNQLMVGNELMLIDMDTLCVGDSIFELASVCNSYFEFTFLDSRSVEDFLGISVDKAKYIWKRVSRKYYSDLSDEQYEHQCNKARVLGCMRALHFFNKRGYPKETFDQCLKDLHDALTKIA